MNNLGIYIHIPFCKKKCDYCDFISFQNKENKIVEYVAALKKEIKSVSKKEVKNYIIKTIYIGGGTPSFINSTYIQEILTDIKNSFEVSENCEITIEINPGTVDKNKLKSYYDAGINRISIGMQSSSNNTLKTIGRIHTYETFLEAYSLIKEIGFKNINIDIMIGLPNQTLNDVEDIIEKIIKLAPTHISVYSLILEENTKLERKIRNHELVLPEEEAERKMYWLVKRRLEEADYIHYEISNFAKKGYESKHNLDCWNQKEYIGFGIAAHSYLNNKRYSNTENLEEYSDVSAKIIHEIQTKETKQKEFMLLGLRKIEGVKISDFKNKFINNPIYLYKDDLYKLALSDLIEIDDNYIRLTDKGIDLANLVWEEFI